MIDILPSTFFQERRKYVLILLLVGFFQHVIHPLQQGHQQLQPAQIGNVGGNVGAIHALHPGFDLQLLELLIGDIGKGELHQMDALLESIAA